MNKGRGSFYDKSILQESMESRPIKVVFLGEKTSGLTEIISVLFGQAQGSVQSETTKLMEFRPKTVIYNNRTVTFNLWQLGQAQQDPRLITSSYLKGSDAVVLVIDVAAKWDRQNFVGWMSLIENNTHKGMPIFVLCTRVETLSPEDGLQAKVNMRLVMQEYITIAGYYYINETVAESVESAFENLTQITCSKVFSSSHSSLKADKTSGISRRSQLPKNDPRYNGFDRKQKDSKCC